MGKVLHRHALWQAKHYEMFFLDLKHVVFAETLNESLCGVNYCCFVFVFPTVL